ncbi:hypothetical protein OH77DRAFT_1389384, partial [Trametes cingulata]
SLWANNSLAAASLTMLYYDYCLTLGPEIDYFWGTAKFSLASVLFVLNRYLGVLGPIPVIFEYFGQFTPQVRVTCDGTGPWACRQLQVYHQYYAIVVQVVIGVILVIRTVALYNGSKRVLWCLAAMVLGILLTLVALNVVSSPPPSGSTSSIQRAGACDLSLTIQQWSAIGWISMLCVETATFFLTVFKSLHMRTSLRHGLLKILFRDGAIYYGIMVIVGVANILTFIVHDDNRGIATTLTNALSTTLASRMFLNLRDPNLHRSTLRIGRLSLLPESRFEAGHSPSSPGDARTLSFRISVGSDTEDEQEGDRTAIRLRSPINVQLSRSA